MQPKKQILHSGYLTNSYASTLSMRVLGYAKGLVVVRNYGGGSGITYRIQGTPNLEAGTPPWITLHSGTSINSGAIRSHLSTDPWDALRVQVKNTQSNFTGSVIIYGNADPR